MLIAGFIVLAHYSSSPPHLLSFHFPLFGERSKERTEKEYGRIAKPSCEWAIDRSRAQVATKRRKRFPSSFEFLFNFLGYPCFSEVLQAVVAFRMLDLVLTNSIKATQKIACCFLNEFLVGPIMDTWIGTVQWDFHVWCYGRFFQEFTPAEPMVSYVSIYISIRSIGWCPGLTLIHHLLDDWQQDPGLGQICFILLWPFVCGF